MTYDYLPTIRYMGTKAKLLDFIIPEILEVTPNDGIVADIMSGSHAISYALKKNRKLITNDVQQYSESIGIALIENQNQKISSESARVDLLANYEFNNSQKIYTFFTANYTNTYFSEKQCFDIDSLRYTISKVKNRYLSNLYLCALMGSMCKVQSTPGHFAQYMPNSNPRIQKLQNMSLCDEFFKKCDIYKDIVFSKYDNSVYCCNFHVLMDNHILDNVSTIYLDSPYTQEQYSRFYHILETVVKYDSPKTAFKAKYRNDRFMSDFCYKSNVKDEFSYIFSYCIKNKINLIISYSDRGVLPITELINLANSFFPKTSILYHDYKHSMQGKGNTPVREALITCLP